MKNGIIKIGVLGLMVGYMAFAAPAFAIPTFQTYIEGATAGDSVSDADTWFSGANPFKLHVVGAYGSNTLSLTNVTLLVSVAQGETGTISISGNPALLTTPVLVADGSYNPNVNADLNILTNVSGTDGYATTNFLPSTSNFNQHDPLKNDLSDFLLFNLGSFGNSTTGLNDYNADGGTITLDSNAKGEDRIYTISSTGFTRLHFDVYGLETDAQGRNQVKYSWDINPGSHDSTYTNQVPEPSTLLLLGSGLVGLGFFGRRKKL